ncbi:MAG: M14 family zinc carboxypeptidase [Bacteroidota bacterium]
MRRLLAPLLVLASLAPAGAAAPGRAVAAGSMAVAPDTRSIYRIIPARGSNLAGLFTLGLDLAGHGPGSSLDFILTSDEVARVRALGFTPLLLPNRRGGPLASPESPLLNPNLGAYHTVAEAMSEMASYASAHPSISRLDTLGMSLEGRPIVAIEISDNPGVDEGEPEVLLDGCHHARELMSVEVPLYAMRKLLDGYGLDSMTTALVNARRIWIVPVVNPDGHVYVEQNSGGQPSGWWRKNRRPNADGSYGVDLNRNYGVAWGYDDIGSSPTPSSEIYRGTAAFSEPETQVLRAFAASRRLSVAVSYHSYGDLVVYPWGYDRLDTPDNAIFFALGDSMATLNGYRFGNPKSNAIYLTNGSFDDWLYGDTVTKPAALGFTVELNTSDEGGFDPPDNLIGPTCDLNWGPLLTLLRYADDPRRVLGPFRPQSLHVAIGSGATASLLWSDPADPDNPAVDHRVRRIAQVSRALDDAESGTADWDTLRFVWSTARSEDGTHSYWSGSQDNWESILTSRASLDLGTSDSLVVWAWWSLEADYDYWYAQASIDGGTTWHSLAGTYTTNTNPSGQNEGFGVTGSSGGSFLRAAFSLLPYGGKQALVRFRCVTDAVNHGEGLYLDDIAPDPRYGGVTEWETGSADTTAAIDPLPTQPTWFQVLGKDAEGQASPWSDRTLFTTTVSTAPATAGVARADAIERIAPNPANPQAEVRFSLAAGAPGAWRIDAFDAAGRWVARVAAGRDDGAGGARRVSWAARDAAGRDLPSGVYFLRLQHGASRRSVKVTILR